MTSILVFCQLAMFSAYTIIMAINLNCWFFKKRLLPLHKRRATNMPEKLILF